MSANTASGSISATTRAPTNGGSGTATPGRSVSRPARAGGGSAAGSGFGDVPLGHRLLAPLGDHAAAQLGVAQPLHHRQALEGVLAVEHARLVRAAVVEERDPAPERAVDRRAADQHRHVHAAMVELVQRKRHLPRRRHQERREPHRIGPLGDRAVHDHVQGHLAAEIDDPVAVVREDRAHQVLADVVHVAEHRRQHDRGLRLAVEPVEVLLEMGDRALHHLGRLEHERQDQLARAEPVADVLHRRQEHAVQHVHSPVVVAAAALVEGEVDVVLDALAHAVQDLGVDALVGAEALERILLRP